MEHIMIGKGLRAEYDPVLHGDRIYFATDSNQIFYGKWLPYTGEDTFMYGVRIDVDTTSGCKTTVTRIGNPELHRLLPVQSQMRGCILDLYGNVVQYLPDGDWREKWQKALQDTTVGQTLITTRNKSTPDVSRSDETTASDLTDVRNGKKGDVMVELPEYWRKFETVKNVQNMKTYLVKLSTLPLPGYHRVPKKYVSAYEATMDWMAGNAQQLLPVSQEKRHLRSVCSCEPRYAGWNDKHLNKYEQWGGHELEFNKNLKGVHYRIRRALCTSQIGKPATYYQCQWYRDAARAKLPGSTAWNMYTYDVHKDLYWLFTVEYATLNSQDDYKPERDRDGFMQGGLGQGIVWLNWSHWDELNGRFPFVFCGWSDKLGNSSGAVPYIKPYDWNSANSCAMQSSHQVDQMAVPRYRGIENPFGHVLEFADGALIKCGPNSERTFWTCDDPARYSWTSLDGYVLKGNDAPKLGWYDSIIFGEDGDMWADKNSTGSCDGSVGWYDSHYTENTSSSNSGGNSNKTVTLRVAAFGGNANDGLSAGFGYGDSYCRPSASYPFCGSRLVYLPEYRSDADRKLQDSEAS